MEEAVAIRFSQIKELAEEVCHLLSEEVTKLGFAPAEVVLQGPEQARYRLERDVATCEFSLVGDWADARGGKLGQLLFHADGSFFVEQDVVRPHPSKRQWFVEAVNAWGRDRAIKVEARLLRYPD
jgi:hypothetical protein